MKGKIRFMMAMDVASLLRVFLMWTFQINVGSNQTPKNLASVTSLIGADAIDIDSPVFYTSLCLCILLSFLLDFLRTSLVCRNFLFGGKYMKQLLSMLICNRLQTMYVLISDNIALVAIFADSNDS